MENTRATSKNGTLAEDINSLQPWFHNIHLNDGVQTSPHHPYGDFPNFKWQDIKTEIPDDLAGWTALDIGCNAGFYSFELAKRGANVLGIDLDPHYLSQAKWVARQLNLQDRVQFEQMQVYDLARLNEQFDIIVFMGVLYHLRYPLLALDIVAEKVKKMLIFQTLTMPGEEEIRPEVNMSMDDRQEMLQPGWPKMAFIEKRLADDPTNWWAPNHSCIVAMLNTCGLRVVARPGHEMYVAKPDQQLTPVSKTWNRSEYLSALGIDWQKELAWKVGRKIQ